MRLSTKAVILAGALAVFAVVALRGAAILIPTGTWLPQTNLSSARANASAALLQDGRVLITGGDSGSGPAATADFFAADGTISAAPPMVNARSKHVAVTLQDGRVLVAGGVTAGGSATSTAEIYDPVANSWTNVGTGMTEARSGATAAVMQDGRVIITGGQNSSNVSSTIEIFDPVAGSFSSAGMMSSPRTQHAMAVLQDGRVIIIGGSNGTSPIASTDIFDPLAGTISAGPSLAVARFGHSATTLLNGQVVVIGGNNGNADPAQMDVTPTELFDPAAGAFTTLAASMATPREGHLALLLPNNNNVLIVGGMSGGTTIAAAELFMPQESSQGAWTYGFGSTGSMSTARSNAVGSPNQVNAPTSVMQRNGVLMIAGGTDANENVLNTTDAYGFATIQTDQSDYPPGSTVTITGSGFQPLEAVTMQLVESPLIDTHGPYTVQADASGSVSDSSFVTDSYDLNIRFYLTATGATSGFQAQNTFTDANNKLSALMAGAQAPAAIAPGSSATYLLTATFDGNGGSASCSATLSVSGLPPSTSSGSFSSSTVSVSSTTSTLTVSTTGSIASGSYPFTVSAAPANGCGSTTETAHLTLTVSKANPTITWANPADITYGTALDATQLNATASVPGSFVYTPAAGTVLNAGNGQNLKVDFTPTDTTNYNAATKTVQINVNKRNATWNTNPASKTYGDADPSPLTTGSGSNFVTADGVAATYTRATGETVAGGPYHITATLSATVAGALDNYNIINNGADFTISQATLTISVTTAGTTYTGLPYAGATTCSANGVNGEHPTATPSFQDAAHATLGGAPTNAGNYFLLCSAGGAGTNYVANSNTAGFTISQATLTISVTAAGTTYTGLPYAGATTCSANGVNGEHPTATPSFQDAAHATLGGAPTNAGNYFLLCSAGGAGTNYVANSDTAGFTISQATLTISVTAAGTTYTGLPYAGATTCSANGVNGEHPTATPSFQDAAHATLGGAPTNAGNYFLLCSAGGAGTNYVANSNTAGFTISQATLTISVTAAGTTYTGLPYAGATTCSANGVNGEHPTATPSFQDAAHATLGGAPTNAGNYFLLCSAGGAGTNYVANSDTAGFTISQATLTISVTAAGTTYTGLPYAGATTCSANGVNGEHPTATPSFQDAAHATLGGAPTNAGNYFLLCSAGGAGTNYVANSDTAGFTISQATLTISVTAAGTTYTGLLYAGATTCSANGVNGEHPTATPSFQDAAHATLGGAPTNAGNYFLLCSAGGAGTNYVANSDTAGFTISQATLTISVTAAGTTYTGLLYAGATTCSANGVNGEHPTATPSFQDAAHATLGGAPTNAGNYFLLCSAGGAGTNYVANSNTAGFIISQATLTVTADNQSMVLHGTLPPLTFKFTEFVNGENPSVLITQPSCTTTGTSASPAGTYPITCSGGAAANYTFKYVAGSFTILYSTEPCDGDAGHQILQPINANGTSVFNGKSTSPAKFRVCDANGVSVGTIGVVSSFNLIQIVAGTVPTTVNDAVDSTTPDTAFRWDPTGQQWIFNINNKSLASNRTYYFQITLNDGTTILFNYGLK